MPKVSVLMAHSGPPTFLHQACSAIGAQDYRDLELIVVDDGAGLDWERWLGELRCPWRVLHNRQRTGLACSLNNAARAASGVLLARMDSDDASSPSRLKLQVEFMEARPRIAVLGSAVYWLDEQDRTFGRNYPLTEPEDLAVGLSIFNQMCHGSALIRREVFESLAGYDESYAVAQDYELWMRARQAGHAFANLSEPLYGHRIHARSISSRSSATQGDIAGRLAALETAAARTARVADWFAAGRHRDLGRPHESLQMGKLALLLLAAVAAGRVRQPVRSSVIRFAARHALDSAELLLREDGWRHNTAAKFSSLLKRRITA